MTAPVPDIEALRAAEQAATGGPWVHSGLNGIHHGHECVALAYGDNRPLNAEFIVLARNTMPALLAQVTRLRGLVAAQERQIEAVRRLVMDTDGNWLNGEEFDGLAGCIQEVVVPDAATLSLSPGAAVEQESKPDALLDCDQCGATEGLRVVSGGFRFCPEHGPKS